MTTHIFPGLASYRDQFVGAIFNVEERKLWDSSVKTLEVEEYETFNATVFWHMVHKNLLIDQSQKDCETFLKLFIFRQG